MVSIFSFNLERMLMKQQKDNSTWYIILIVACAVFAAFVSAFQAIKPNTLCCVWFICSGVATAALAIVPFIRNSHAHKKQFELLSLIYDILSKDENNFQDNITKSKGKCNAYVQVVLYAMYQSYMKGAFDYKIIDPEHPDIVKFIILTINSTVKSDELFCTFGDDDALVVNEFNVKSLKVITDGRKLVSSYEHFDSEKMVNESVYRINKACGISVSYVKYVDSDSNKA